jgi:hypothetical protein
MSKNKAMKRRVLQPSHFAARGVYLRLRNPKGRVAHPIVVTSKVMMSTSKQVQDYLLCRDCEKRIDQNGKDYVILGMDNLDSFWLRRKVARFVALVEGTNPLGIGHCVALASNHLTISTA